MKVSTPSLIFYFLVCALTIFFSLMGDDMSAIYAKSIVQMVISIAKVKNIKIIAEGVETTEQWECLNQMGCDEIQGYFFSKPELPDEIEQKWITKRILSGK